MKIGVYFTPNKEQGGAYQYSLAILEALSTIPKHQYVVITTSKDVPKKFYNLKRFKVIDHLAKSRELTISTRDVISKFITFISPNFISLLYKKRLFNFLTPIFRFTLRPQIEAIKKEKLDLIFYPTSSNLSFLAKIPSIVTIHDLQHRLNPQFKEVSAGGRWESREYGFINISKSAFRIFVDSFIGKEDMFRFYPESKGKVIVLPYLPPSYINPKISANRLKAIKKKLALPDNYIFYPAKFWPHKNHENLLLALSYMKSKGHASNVVFTGSRDAEFSSYDRVMNLGKRKGLENQIFYLGYVNNEELSAIYKLARAMVMPTYFGPTNIPVLEAWVMGTPVVYSDIRGCREQLGNAGLLVDPNDPKDIAEKVMKVYSNSVLRKKFIERGKIRVKIWTRDNFTRIIRKILEDFERERYESSRTYQA